MQAEPVKDLVRRGRGGRPPAKDAGNVDRRILDAATKLFLRLGFDATSCEQVAAQAGAGKASLYARYASKEDLFAAVVRDYVDRLLLQVDDVPVDIPLQIRLEALGLSIVTQALQPEAVALMRVVISTAYRMPEMARLADQFGRDRAVQRVAAALAGNPAEGADQIDRALHVANTFIDLVFVPIQMRALLGDDPVLLSREAAGRIRDTICLLAESGRLDGC